MNDVNIELEQFVKLYNRSENAIVDNGDEIIINVTSMSANKFIMLLSSLFADTYQFTVLSPNSIKAVLNSNPLDSNEPVLPNDEFKPQEQEFDTSFESKIENKSETKEVDFYKLAERLDNDFVKIEVEEDCLSIEGKYETLEALAKIVDKIDETLIIELYNKKMLIK